MTDPLYDEEECRPIPSGVYSARVSKAEIKTSAAGNRYVACDIQIIQGAQQGKLIDSNFHIYAKDSKFRHDSRRRFSKLVKSCGINGNIHDPAEILDKPFLMELGETKDKFGDTNCIVGFEKLRKGE